MIYVHIELSIEQCIKGLLRLGMPYWHFQVFLLEEILGSVTQPVNVLFADQSMTTHRSGASQLLRDSPAKLFNESVSQDQREEPPLQVASRPYGPSNVYYGVSQEKNRNHPKFWQLSGAQKVLLCQCNSPPPVKIITSRPPDMHHDEPEYELVDPPADCDLNTLKKSSKAEGLLALTPVDKGMMIHRGTATSLVPSASPDRQKNQFLSIVCPMAARSLSLKV